jgi:CRP-like cAMP-binding protein
MHISLPLIKSNHVFTGCSSGFTASLSVLMREVTFTCDETIFHTNDVCSELYLIAKNSVKILVNKNGQEVVRSTL